MVAKIALEPLDAEARTTGSLPPTSPLSHISRGGRAAGFLTRRLAPFARVSVHGNNNKTTSSKVQPVMREQQEDDANDLLSMKPCLPAKAEELESDCTHITTTHSNSNKRRRRKVHFDVDRNDDIKSDVHTFERTDPADKDILYSTRLDSKLRKAEARVYAHQYARTNRDCLHSIEILFDSPLKRSRCSAPGGDINLTDDDAVRILSESEARGLEMRMSALMWKHQKYTVTSVVQRYQTLVDEELPIDDVQYFLRTRCIHLSQCASDYARSLAKGDEMIARKIYDEEQETTETESETETDDVYEV